MASGSRLRKTEALFSCDCGPDPVFTNHPQKRLELAVETHRPAHGFCASEPPHLLVHVLNKSDTTQPFLAVPMLGIAASTISVLAQLLLTFSPLGLI